MHSRQEIKFQAKVGFYQNYWLSVGAVFIAYAIIGLASSLTFFIAGLGGLFIFPPLIVGLSYVTLAIYRSQVTSIEDLFKQGFANYLRNLGGILWLNLFVFLWSLLFLIPGIIKSFAYFATPYLLAEYPNLGAREALKVSMRMTDGHKTDIFVMYLSFIGWFLLSSISMGIVGIFYGQPYFSLSLAGLYEDLKEEAIQQGRISLAELA